MGEGAREAGETSVHNARRGEKEGSEERRKEGLTEHVKMQGKSKEILARALVSP